MQWYVPSWNGDIRFESDGDDKTVIKVIEPTADEIRRLDTMTQLFKEKGWVSTQLWKPNGDPKEQVTEVKTGILNVADQVIKNYAPGKATLTAIVFSDGSIETVESDKNLLVNLEDSLGITAEREEAERKAKEEEEEEAARKKKEAEKAVSVKRHTVCCPRCISGPLTAAGEVLRAFLTDEEWKEYSENDHSLIVTGGLSHHKYIVSHRHAKWARHHHKICHDLTNGHTLHFHDWTVPPEEELLAAILILRYREHWLRTAGSGSGAPSYSSGFGDGMDGTRSTSFTWAFGNAMTQVEEVFTGPQGHRGFHCY